MKAAMLRALEVAKKIQADAPSHYLPPQEGTKPRSENIIPNALVAGTRGYIEKIASQINGSYEMGWFDACSVLMRRLLETLIIECFVARGIEHRIQDPNSGDFLSMSATPEVIKSIGWSGDSFFEQPIGWSASDSYAEVVLAYMDEYPGDLKPEITAKISALLSQQVRTNTYAQRQFDQVTPEEVMNSRLVVYPFKELEICVYTEGAAAVIFAEEETAKAISRNSGQPVVWITGVGEANEHSFAGTKQKNMSRIMSDYYASHRAYEMAGIQDPTEAIDIVELLAATVFDVSAVREDIGEEEEEAEDVEKD